MKSPPWLWAEDCAQGRLCVLAAEEARHLSASLRRQVGDDVVLTDGCGCVAEGRIHEIDGTRVVIKVRALRRERAPAVDVEMAVAVLHTQAMEWAIQKAVEVGVNRLYPLLCERAQVSSRAVESRRKKWDKIVREACKQCHRCWRMELAQVMSFEDLIATWGGDAVYAHRDGRPPFGGNLEGRLRMAIGPEGGFSEEELQIADDAGWIGVRLGDHVLRTETAVAVGGAILGLAESQTSSPRSA